MYLKKVVILRKLNLIVLTYKELFKYIIFYSIWAMLTFTHLKYQPNNYLLLYKRLWLWAPTFYMLGSSAVHL